MDKSSLEQRTKQFALQVIRFTALLPKNRVTEVIGRQLLRSGTSIGANYREANRGESRNDFIHKIGIVEKEAAETQYWLELITESNLGGGAARTSLVKECSELLAIFTSIGKSSKSRS